jgi:hypothetical protein
MRLSYPLSATIVALLLAVAPSARADDPPEQKVLDRWVGNWKTTYKVPKAEWTPEERTGTAELTSSRVLGGKFVQEKSEHSDKTSSVLMLTYDEEKKSYRSWWFSSTGQTAESTGKWDPEAKTMTWTSAGNSEFTSTVRQRYVDDDHAEWDVVVQGGTGKVFFKMEGKSVRTSGAKK